MESETKREERLELGVARAEATPIVKDLVAILEYVKDDLTALRAQPAHHRLARLTQPLCVRVDLVEEERRVRLGCRAPCCLGVLPS